MGSCLFSSGSDNKLPSAVLWGLKKEEEQVRRTVLKKRRGLLLLSLQPVKWIRSS